nr:hypothetical protein [Tanacetum cinerariifolium]
VQRIENKAKNENFWTGGSGDGSSDDAGTVDRLRGTTPMVTYGILIIGLQVSALVANLRNNRLSPAGILGSVIKAMISQSLVINEAVGARKLQNTPSWSWAIKLDAQHRIWTCNLVCKDEFVNKHVVENCNANSSKEEPKVVRKNDDAIIIEEWVSDNEEEDVS